MAEPVTPELEAALCRPNVCDNCGKQFEGERDALTQLCTECHNELDPF